VRPSVSWEYNTITRERRGATRRIVPSAICPDLNRHAPFSGDKEDRRSRERVSFSVCIFFLGPTLSNLFRNQLNHVFFYSVTHLSGCELRNPLLRRHDDRCRRNKIAKSPMGLPGRFKIPLTKGISSYWYQHRRFGYISLVTFGSRWTSREGRRTEQMRTIGNRTSGSVQ